MAPVRHRQRHACAHGCGHVDSFGNLLIGRAQSLRSCEVGHRSGLTMVGQDEGEMHQRLGFGGQSSLGVGLVEVIGKFGTASSLLPFRKEALFSS